MLEGRSSQSPGFAAVCVADVHFWNYQGREVLVSSMIDETTRFHVTQILPSQSARDLYEPHVCLGEMGRSSTLSVG